MVTSARSPLLATHQQFAELLPVIGPGRDRMPGTVYETYRRNLKPVPIDHGEDTHVIEAFGREQGEVTVQPCAIVLCAS